MCSSILSSTTSDDGRRVALGTYNFAGDLGKFIITGSSSLLLAAGVAWQAPVIGFGMMLVLSAALLMFALKRLKAGGRPAQPDSADIQRAKGWGITNRAGFVSLCAIAAIDSSTRASTAAYSACAAEIGRTDQSLHCIDLSLQHARFRVSQRHRRRQAE